MVIDYLRKLKMQDVYDHYVEREGMHQRLRKLFDTGMMSEYVPLALGIDEDRGLGNYSARQRHSGPRIRKKTADGLIFEFASTLNECAIASDLPGIIRYQGVSGIGISIGSEMATMLHPENFWIGNRRTYWARILVESGNAVRANEALQLLCNPEDDGEMQYEIWNDLYPDLDVPLRQLIAIVSDNGLDEGFAQRHATYLWADAIADALFTALAEGKNAQ